MKKKVERTISSIWQKISDAFRGLFIAFYEETSLYAISFIIILSYVIGGILNKKMSTYDWIFIVLSTFLILAIEIINTAIENLVDLVNFKYNLKAKKIKNISAAASLVIILGVIIVLCIIFIPKIIN